jgi:beta-glucanase (GH16 family)
MLAGVIASWVDPDSPPSAHHTYSLVDGRKFDLVFSDEFNVVGRTFDDGHDTRWTAIHKNDYTNTALQYDNHIYIHTIQTNITCNYCFLV